MARSIFTLLGIVLSLSSPTFAERPGGNYPIRGGIVVGNPADTLRKTESPAAGKEDGLEDDDWLLEIPAESKADSETEAAAWAALETMELHPWEWNRSGDTSSSDLPDWLQELLDALLGKNSLYEICGRLYGTDTRDRYERGVPAGTYDFEVSASGGGRLRFKVEAYQPPMLGGGGGGFWYAIEPRSRVASGSQLTGSFRVPDTHLSSSVSIPEGTIRIIFSRGAGTRGVDYDFSFSQH